MAEFSRQPIHPGGQPALEAESLIATWRALKLRGKVVVVLYALLGGTGSAYASYFLVSEVHHWGAWLFALLILDPIALAAFVFLAVLVAPRSFYASWLASAFRRAGFAAIIVGLGMAAILCSLLGYVAWELWKSR